jgi:hypothetical protein
MSFQIQTTLKRAIMIISFIWREIPPTTGLSCTSLGGSADDAWDRSGAGNVADANCDTSCESSWIRGDGERDDLRGGGVGDGEGGEASITGDGAG